MYVSNSCLFLNDLKKQGIQTVGGTRDCLKINFHVLWVSEELRGRKTNDKEKILKKRVRENRMPFKCEIEI